MRGSRLWSRRLICRRCRNSVSVPPDTWLKSLLRPQQAGHCPVCIAHGVLADLVAQTRRMIASFTSEEECTDE